MMGNTGDPEYMAAYIRARALADAERAARSGAPHRCPTCWTPLYPYSTTPYGMATITVTTCPVCDRWREGDDR